MSFNKSNNSSGELSDRVVTPLRMFRQISPPSYDNIQALSDSPLLDDQQQTKANKKSVTSSDLDKQMARRKELELWRLKKKVSTTTSSTTPTSISTSKVPQQAPITSAQITSPFSSHQRLRRTQNNPSTSNAPGNSTKPTTHKLLFSELSPRRVLPESRKRKSTTEQQPSIHPPPKKTLTNNNRGNIYKPDTRNVQPIHTSRPPQVSTTKFIPSKHQAANETNQLNLSSILIVEDRTLFEEDKHMLDNIVKITDSLEDPTLVQQEQISNSINNQRENDTQIPTSMAPKIEESKTNTSFANNEPSILLDVSYTGSEPRSARKSMKQKSFISNPANSVAFSPLVNKSKSLTASLLTPVNTMESLTRVGGTNDKSLFGEFSLLDDSKPSTTRGASQLLPDLTNPTNLSSLTKTINLNTSISNDLDQLKLKIFELEENLKRERKEKEMWMEKYKNLLLSNNQQSIGTNTSLLSRSFTTLDPKPSLSNRSFNNGSFLTEPIKR
ncbi:predicted protein [Naegleria gruberi]|uniref:Predicted protein n=1 Tax=Naegleria gruberi TaxID=5762 RepID=D2V7H6_NAEGR|nr:uncharacterized protein NAEGRDRAFT_64805 [Naegleria gruberi]EFC47380.1 predicted protein [Naegleria gruberi]|eukprot:XP_002680124.1 predicted protein [Naegleria gruberi strain NEG-M]